MTEWRARRWRKLLNLIDGLPRHSAYVEAISNDEKLAEVLVDRPPLSDEKNRPRISEYTPTVERLDVVIDRLAELANVIVAVNGGKPSDVKHMPRPATALERVRNRRRYAKHQSIVARVMRRRPVPAE